MKSRMVENILKFDDINKNILITFRANLYSSNQSKL